MPEASIAGSLEQTLQCAWHQHTVMDETDDEHDTVITFNEDHGVARVADFPRRVRHMRSAVRDMIDTSPAVLQRLPRDQRVSGITGNSLEGREDQSLIALLNEFAELLLTPGQDIDEVVFGSGR